REHAPLIVSTGASPDRPRRGELAILSIILAAAAALRLYDLGDGLWIDEMYTLDRYVRRPLGYVLTTFDNQNQHLLYSVLAWVAVEIFGDNNAALRLPAAAFGVASLWALWRFARLVTDRREALFATAFLAVSYHHVWFSQNARGYSGLLFFTLLGSEAFWRMLTAHRPSAWRAAIAYAVAMSLGVAIHVTALFAVAGHGLLWLGLLVITRRRDLGPNRWHPAVGFALTAGFSLLFYALVAAQFPLTMGDFSLSETPSFGKARYMIAEASTGLAKGLPGGWLALIPGVAIVALGVGSYARQSLALPALFSLGALVTMVGTVAMNHPLWPRFFFFCVGFLSLIVFRGIFTLFGARGVESPSPLGRRAAFSVALVFCLASAATVPRAHRPKQDFGGAAAYLQSVVAPGDAVATTLTSAFAYRDLLQIHGWGYVRTPEDLKALEAAHSRTWVVYSRPKLLRARQPDVWRRLQEEYRLARLFPGTLGDGEVVVRVR
ncbi:MAG: glycosyltransferase family 39 protein, partial [Candidatus Binatia bacterium]